MNKSDQKIEFIFGENNNYHRIGISYLQYDITVKNCNDKNFADEDVIKLIDNAFSCCFKGATLATTGGSDIEYNKYYGNDSTILRILTNK